MLGTRVPVYPLLSTRYSAIRYSLPVTRYPPAPAPTRNMSWPRFAARPNDDCLSPPLSLYASGAAFVCLPVNQRFVVALPALTGTYNCLIVNVVVVVVVVILENIFLKIFLHIFSVQLRNSYKFQHRGPTRR